MRDKLENIIQNKLEESTVQPPKHLWKKIAKNAQIGAGGSGFTPLEWLSNLVISSPLVPIVAVAVSGLLFLTNQKSNVPKTLEIPLASEQTSPKNPKLEVHSKDTIRPISTKGKPKEIEPKKQLHEALVNSPEVKKNTQHDLGPNQQVIERKFENLQETDSIKTSNLSKQQDENSEIALVDKKVEVPNTYTPTELAPIPNIITPHTQDGYNDKFVVDFGHIELEKFRLLIVNYTGEILFDTENPGNYWDGKNASGELVPKGNYIYQIVFKREGHSTEEIKQGKLNVR